MATQKLRTKMAAALGLIKMNNSDYAIAKAIKEVHKLEKQIHEALRQHVASQESSWFGRIVDRIIS